MACDVRLDASMTHFKGATNLYFKISKSLVLAAQTRSSRGAFAAAAADVISKFLLLSIKPPLLLLAKQRDAKQKKIIFKRLTNKTHR